MGIVDRKIASWTSPVIGEADRPNRGAAEMKAVFDSNANQLKEAVNGIIDDLIAGDGIPDASNACLYSRALDVILKADADDYTPSGGGYETEVSNPSMAVDGYDYFVTPSDASAGEYRRVAGRMLEVETTGKAKFWVSGVPDTPLTIHILRIQRREANGGI